MVYSLANQIEVINRIVIVNTLVQIKRLVIARRVFFTKKARTEIERDRLTEDLILEAILNAPLIQKRLNSLNPTTGKRETLFVISGFTYTGLVIYTKGKVVHLDGTEYYYVLISSKRSVA